jgi:cysteine desulfurase
MIYFDNSATTSLAPEVLDAMQPFLEGEFGNASSVHAIGQRARVALEEAREVIAQAICAEPKEIVFTSGGTESNNSAIKGALFHHYMEHFSGKSWNDLLAVTSPAEHQAVLEPFEWFSKLGAKISYGSVDSFGHAILRSIEEKINSDTAIVSIMMVNNETGAINSVAEIAKMVKVKSKALIHSDAVQALGKIPIDVRELGVDFLSISAHKIYGPKGIGALYIKAGTPWEPLLHGGSQERNRRGGTESVALALGFAEAVRLAIPNSTALNGPTGLKGLKLPEYFQKLRKYLLEKLNQIPEVVLNSATDESSVDAIVNFSFVPEVLARLDADALIIRFDMEGIAVSNGSACTSGSQQPSHVLLAMGKSAEVAMKSVRVSFSRYNTISEIDKFIEALNNIIPKG